jgi:protein TonB
VPTPAAESQAKTTPSPKILAAWRGKVLAHLASHKRAAANSAGGVSTVAFSIDRAGRVLSAQILKSSGNTALDKEAVALTRRASPVPAPPSDLAGSKLYLKVPIQFAR